MQGEALGVADMKTRRDFAVAWQQYGGDVLRAWVKAFPGSRPLGGYIAGRFPWWPGENPHKALVRKGSLPVVPDYVDLSLHRGWEEFETLLEAGVIDKSEARAAEQRLSDPAGASLSRYQYLAKAGTF